MIPMWAMFGLCTAMLTALTMLMQEKLKADGFALAFWNKVICAIVMSPFAFYHGLPHQPLFYIYLGATALLFGISDVVFFRAVAIAGAGTVSRILPASVIFSFILWFVMSPSLLETYFESPFVTVMIFIVLCLWVWFATHVRRCQISMKALEMAWFVIFAAIIGPLLGKRVTENADMAQGPYAYVFVQSLMMVTLWLLYFFFKGPVTSSVMFSRSTLRAGMIIGVISSISVAANVLAYYYVDNPAYVSAVGFLNSVIILLAYAAMGRKNDGNVVAGLGMVACAAALIILREWI